MRKQFSIVIVVLVIGFGGLFGGKWYTTRAAAAAAATRGAPPVSVSTALAKESPWRPETHVVGTLEAVSGTEVTAQIAGNVMEIAFHSGAEVKKGDLLVRLDDSSQRALLHADEAKLKLAEADLARTKKVFAAHASSQADLQAAQAAYGAAKAAVEGDQASLRKLNISAPFSGVVGIRQVSLGQYVSPGTAVVDLQSYDPMFLDFSLPQSALAELAKGQNVQFTVNTYAGKTFTGKVTAIASRIDPTTRNVNVQATIPNHDKRLRPGMYGTVELSLGAAQHGIVVPATALTYNTFGDSVYVVTKNRQGDLIAKATVVQVADQRDGRVLLGSGVANGVTVVTAGQNKLRDGARVTVNNAVQQ